MNTNKKNYNKTIIYQIVNGSKCHYIDSTNNFTQKKSSYKNGCNNDTNTASHNSKLYKFMRENGWNGNFEKGGWDIIPIEKYSCNDALEANARVYHHLTLLKPTL